MSNDDIDLDRVVTDPIYRRAVIDRLNSGPASQGDDASLEPAPADDQGSSKHRGQG